MMKRYVILAMIGSAVMSGCISQETGVLRQHGGLVAPEYEISQQFEGPLQVLGVARMFTNSETQSYGAEFFEEEFTIFVPLGTEVIIPSVSAWLLQFDEDIDSSIDIELPLSESGQSWRTSRKFTRGLVWVTVVDIHAPSGRNPLRQWATIKVTMNLTEKTGGKKWAGGVEYHLTFLGTPIDPGTTATVVWPRKDWQPVAVLLDQPVLPDPEN